MFFVDLIFALLIAALLTLLFVPVLGWRRPGTTEGALLIFFLAVFAVTWAGSVWVTPFGPTVYGAPFLVFLFVGLTTAILIAAATPPPPRGETTRLVTGPEDDPRVYTEPVFNWFFWLLLGITVIAIIAAYV